MKNEILDEIIEDAAYQLLEKDEKIIWEGNPIFQPNYNFISVKYTDLNDDKLKVFILLFGSGILAFFYWIGVIWLFVNALQPAVVFFLIAAILVFISPRLLIRIKRKHTRYIITDQQIIFQLWVFPKIQYHNIPFSEIKDFIISDDDQKHGLIFLIMKDQQKIRFETFDLINGEKRHQPTLEMLEDVNEVAQYIKKGIQGKL